MAPSARGADFWRGVRPSVSTGYLNAGPVEEHPAHDAVAGELLSLEHLDALDEEHMTARM